MAARLPTDATDRKAVPLATGCIDYFPAALAAVAELSKRGNDQHNPGSALHWDRAKSTDEADALMRHFLERGTRDADGIRHSAKVAWRALALLEKELEAEAPASLEDVQEALDRTGYGQAIHIDRRPNETLQQAADRALEEYRHTRHGFRLGESVNTIHAMFGSWPGTVVGFCGRNVKVSWDMTTVISHVAPEQLRHGA